MQLINTLLFYTIFASSLLLYGIGLSKLSVYGLQEKRSFLYYLKAVLSILISSCLGFLLCQYILIPLQLMEIFPILVLLIFIISTILLQTVVKQKNNLSFSELTVGFLIVLLSLMESTSIIDTLLIDFSSFLTILIISPLILIFQKRIGLNGRILTEKYYSWILLFIALFICILTVVDISWLNSEIIL